jgi:conjugal transfer mating pair stabilization protein TraN
MIRRRILGRTSAMIALLGSTALQAQTLDPKAAASQVAQSLQGQVTSTVTNTNAPSSVPGYGGADLPQSNYLKNPSQMSGDGAVATVTSQPYAIITNPNRGSFDPSTLGLASAQGVEASPNSYTGVSTSSTDSSCQPLPARSGGSSTYYDSCQVGSAESDSNFTCTIAWAAPVVTGYRYACHMTNWYSLKRGLPDATDTGVVTDCGSFESQPTCSLASTQTQRLPNFSVAGSSASLAVTETERIYTCSDQKNYGTGPWGSSCLRNDSACFVPPALITASGAAGSTFLGPIETTGGSQIDNSDCQSKLAAATASGATCLPPTQVCTDSLPATRTVGGVSVTHDCWQWQATYQCGALTSANTCATLAAKANCSFDHTVCLDDPQVGACQVTSQVYKCTTPNPTEAPGSYACNGSVYCLDGSCTTLPTSPTPDLGKALVAINAMGDAKGQFDPNALTIFNGNSAGCHKPLFGLVNCCAGKVSGMLTAASSATALAGILTGGYGFLLSMVTQFLVTFLCSQQEMLLDVQDRMGLCHYVGEYCSQKALFVCTTERLSYCCYQSELARVIQEQGRAQLGMDFGTPKNPSCGGFTVAQFSQLDLSKMDFSEVYANFTSAVSLPSSLQTSAQIQAQVQQYYQNAGATGTKTGSTP